MRDFLFPGYRFAHPGVLMAKSHRGIWLTRFGRNAPESGRIKHDLKFVEFDP
jgi:hypothetical protein